MVAPFLVRTLTQIVHRSGPRSRHRFLLTFNYDWDILCAFGFNRTFADMGIGEEEVRQHIRKRRQELAEEKRPPADPAS